jgi:hypothetical protein
MFVLFVLWIFVVWWRYGIIYGNLAYIVGWLKIFCLMAGSNNGRGGFCSIMLACAGRLVDKHKNPVFMSVSNP